MFLLKLAAGDLNQTPLDWPQNTANIVAAIDEARAGGASLLCLPELCITGYGCEDAFLSSGCARTALDVLGEIVPHTRGMIVSLGLPLRFQKAVYNAVCLVADGHVLGFVCKRFLAGEGLHYEPRWFKPWPEGVRAKITIDGIDYPIGDVCFRLGGVGIGFEICEDAWVAERTGAELAARGVDIILNPSASHFAFGKAEIRRRFVLEGSRAFGATYVYANLQGNEAGRIIYDGGAMIAAAGRMLATGRRFSYEQANVTFATTDIDDVRDHQARVGSYRPDLSEQDACTVAPFVWPAAELAAESAAPEAWETGPHLKEEEFTRAECLGLFDYMRKSRSRGFVISLSGGADSTACATLVADMVAMALDELGPEAFHRRLAYLDLPTEATREQIVRTLLACVYQSTENSSDTTRQAARGVAEALSADYLEFDVEELVQSYTEMVAGGIGRELSWERDDVALQNIQARVRAPGVWMLANLRGALLVATSNRSEAAVGYATMDGDTCGGISPIAGIDKAFLRQWLRWRETDGPAGLGPLPILSRVNRLAPTAELRPLEQVQTDEADLMPYDLLDAIEREAIGRKRTPSEVFQVMRLKFGQYTPQQLAAWIDRFYRLWCRNQWKRERYAPSFHVDDKNLDPKTWCRFPILSGGFERELAEMHALISQKSAGG